MLKTGIQPGNIFKGASWVQGSLDVPAVIQGKMFLVAWYVLAHGISSTAVGRIGKVYHKD